MENGIHRTLIVADGPENILATSKRGQILALLAERSGPREGAHACGSLQMARELGVPLVILFCGIFCFCLGCRCE